MMCFYNIAKVKAMADRLVRVEQKLDKTLELLDNLLKNHPKCNCKQNGNYTNVDPTPGYVQYTEG